MLTTEIVSFAEEGKDVNKTFLNDDWTAVQFAASMEDSGATKTLLVGGTIDPNYRTSSKVIPQVTALHIAARRGNIDVLKTLLPYTDVNVQDQYGFTALHYAAVAKHKEAVRFLLNNGASAILTSKSGCTPYDLAKELGYEDMADLLISKMNLEKDPLIPQFKAWLNHLGAGEYLPRFVEAGYDLKFVYEKSLNASDMENLSIPTTKYGLYRKILEKYEIDKFYSPAADKDDEEDDDEDGSEDGSGEESEEEED